jgi:hypothetical protein
MRAASFPESILGTEGHDGQPRQGFSLDRLGRE